MDVQTEKCVMVVDENLPLGLMIKNVEGRTCGFAGSVIS